MRTTKTTMAVLAFGVLALSAQSCIDNNNKDGGTGSDTHESDYGREAPTYNKTRDDIEKAEDTVTESKRIPKDSVEILSKGNASSK